MIGDKSGAFTAFAMKKKNAVEAVNLLEKTAGAKVKFVHVVRNPFDNIATMVLQHRNVQARYGEHKVKVWSINIMFAKRMSLANNRAYSMRYNAMI